MNIHDLGGCAPAPLAHYLKALGILRLVSKQADPQVRAWWEGERFRLATQLSRAELEYFFLERYQPTPIFNPWGARSGFYPGSSEKSARTVLGEIARSADDRFSAYRDVVHCVREAIAKTTAGSKPEGEDADKLILAIRRVVRGEPIRWLDAVAAVMRQEKPGMSKSREVAFPALFGTGGSEGSGSYTSAFMAAIDQCLLKRKWDHAVRLVIFGENDRPWCQWDQSMGQFLPEGAGTPWDLLLAFEGGCIMRSAVSTRASTAGARWMSSPFYVAPTSYGYPSEARLDEHCLNKGKEMPGRGEQWFPLWSQPMTFSEVNQLFTEGRAAAKRTRAADGWSMVRAISSLGVRRGLREFVRYGYQQRNNMATHFAIPLGRFRVPDRTSPVLACLDDLDSWLPRLRRQARDKHAPARLASAERRLADALFAVAQHPDEPDRWQLVLLALAEVESVLVTGSGFKAGPVPRLRPEWVRAADDGSPEFRLAVACALQARSFGRDSSKPFDSVRRHWLPLQRGRFATSGTGGQARLESRPDVVLRGRNGLVDAVALVERRLIEAGQRGERRLPLVAARFAAAYPADLAAVIAGEVELDRTMALARALMALDGRAWVLNPRPPARPVVAHRTADDAWLVIRLALLPWPLPDGRHLGADPAILRRLASGDAGGAVELAARRLHAAGIRAALRAATVPPETAARWAAALAFPITRKTAARLVRRLDPKQEVLS